MNKMIDTIKDVHQDYVCMFKVGTFYHVYNKDAYIMSYIFDYKIKEVGNKIKECGFPLSALPKVIAKLENNKINYITIDRRNNYDVDSKENYKNLNNYDKFYEKSRKYINKQKRIDSIVCFLKENINEEDFFEIINEMEKVMYERRKV